MADIEYPSDIIQLILRNDGLSSNQNWIAASELRLIHPGRREQQNPFTGRIQRTAFGERIWSYRATTAPFGTQSSQRSVMNRIQTFQAQASDVNNVAVMPTNKESIPISGRQPGDGFEYPFEPQQISHHIASATLIYWTGTRPNPRMHESFVQLYDNRETAPWFIHDTSGFSADIFGLKNDWNKIVIVQGINPNPSSRVGVIDNRSDTGVNDGRVFVSTGTIATDRDRMNYYVVDHNSGIRVMEGDTLILFMRAVNDILLEFNIAVVRRGQRGVQSGDTYGRQAFTVHNATFHNPTRLRVGTYSPGSGDNNPDPAGPFVTDLSARAFTVLDMNQAYGDIIEGAINSNFDWTTLFQTPNSLPRNFNISSQYGFFNTSGSLTDNNGNILFYLPPRDTDYNPADWHGKFVRISFGDEGRLYQIVEAGGIESNISNTQAFIPRTRDILGSERFVRVKTAPKIILPNNTERMRVTKGDKIRVILSPDTVNTNADGILPGIDFVGTEAV